MPAGSHRFEAGTIRCTVLSDGYFAYPTRWFFPDADPVELRRSLEARRLPLDNILSPYTCLLIETGRHVVLVDTGAGEAMRTAGAITARLETAGVRSRDIDTVVLTHAHPDHIGGTLDLRGRPAFPAARHVLAEAELEFWTAPHPDLCALRLPDDVKDGFRAQARRTLHTLRHQLEPVAGEGEIVPGVRAIPAPGHTPGHMALIIGEGANALLHLGDAALHPLHLEHPQWENSFDHSGAAAAETRRALATRAAAGGMRVLAFHFPFPSVGRIAARDGDGWTWTPDC